MPLAERNHLKQFLLFVFALLIPCFALWTVISPWLATPAVGLVHLILTAWFPGIVDMVYQQGADALLMTRFTEINGELVATADMDSSLGFRLNTRLLSYSIPFYAALHFATQRASYLADFLWGLLLLYPLIVFGLLCLCARQLMVNLGALFFNQPEVLVPHANVIAILYQLNVLIIPTLAPVAIWVWQSRDTQLFRSVLAASAPDDSA